MYEKIYELCAQKGIKPGKMCNDLGISRSFITELKMGRVKRLSTEKVEMIAKYLGTTADYLISGEIDNSYEIENAVTKRNDIDDELYKLISELSETDRAIATAYVQGLIAKRGK